VLFLYFPVLDRRYHRKKTPDALVKCLVISAGIEDSSRCGLGGGAVHSCHLLTPASSDQGQIGQAILCHMGWKFTWRHQVTASGVPCGRMFTENFWRGNSKIDMTCSCCMSARTGHIDEPSAFAVGQMTASGSLRTSLPWVLCQDTTLWEISNNRVA
jgi:hypothetical protein